MGYVLALLIEGGGDIWRTCRVVDVFKSSGWNSKSAKPCRAVCLRRVVVTKGLKSVVYGQHCLGVGGVLKVWIRVG